MSEAPEEALTLVKHVYELAKSDLEQTGSMLPKAIIYGKDTAIIVAGVFSGDDPAEIERSKNNFSTYTRIAAVAYRAEEVAYISEAWSLNIPNSPEAQAEFAKWRETHYSFQEHPDRVEILLISLETQAGMVSAVFTQQRESENYATLTPFEEGKITWTERGKIAEQMFGRFANFLPPPSISENEDLVAAAEFLLNNLHEEGNFHKVEVPKPTFH